MTDDNTHIALLHYDKVPEELLDEFCTTLNTDSIKFESVSQPEPGLQASIEWLALPAIAVFLLKPYFKSFMKEAGKDHYYVLKRAFRALGRKLFSRDQKFRVVILPPSGEKKLEYLLLFAIYAAVDDDNVVKLLLRENCSEEEFCASIEAFLDFVESYHSEDVECGTSINLDVEGRKGDITLVAYDGKSKSLRNVSFTPDQRSGGGNDD